MCFLFFRSDHNEEPSETSPPTHTRRERTWAGRQRVFLALVLVPSPSARNTESDSERHHNHHPRHSGSNVAVVVVRTPEGAAKSGRIVPAAMSTRPTKKAHPYARVMPKCLRLSI